MTKCICRLLYLREAQTVWRVVLRERGWGRRRGLRQRALHSRTRQERAWTEGGRGRREHSTPELWRSALPLRGTSGCRLALGVLTSITALHNTALDFSFLLVPSLRGRWAERTSICTAAHHIHVENSRLMLCFTQPTYSMIQYALAATQHKLFCFSLDH